MTTVDCIFFLIVVICLAGIQSHIKLNCLRQRLEEIESRLGVQSPDKQDKLKSGSSR